MNVPLDAKVRCQDGMCGRSAFIIIDPIDEQVTHFVIWTNRFPSAEYLVPVDWVVASTEGLIEVCCTQAELARCVPFTQGEFFGPTDAGFDLLATYGSYDSQGILIWPYLTAEDSANYLDAEQVPLDEFTVSRGMDVKATDDPIGWVDSFLVNPNNHHITHLILRQGYLRRTEHVTLPVTAIAHIEDDIVYLSLSKDEVRALPAVSVRRL